MCFAGLDLRHVCASCKAIKMTLYKKFVTVAVIAVAIGSIGDWTQHDRGWGFNDLVTNTLHADPSDVSNRFQAILAAPANADGQHLAGGIPSFNPATTLADGVASLLVWFIGKVAWLHHVVVAPGANGLPLLCPVSGSRCSSGCSPSTP